MIIRETKSICPTCGEQIYAFVSKEDDLIYYNMSCSKDGDFKILLSKNGEKYIDYEDFYFKQYSSVVNNTSSPILNKWVFITNICNMNCEYCGVSIHNPQFDVINSDDLKQIISDNKSSTLSLSGGEPTMISDLFPVIELLNNHSDNWAISTNGIKLNDFDFCKELKRNKVKSINISTETFKYLNTDFKKITLFYKEKMSAISNLEKLKINTVLQPTIIKGVNEDHILESINIAKTNFYIHTISFNGFSLGNDKRGLYTKHIMMADEIMDIINDNFIHTNREYLYNIHKIFLLLQTESIKCQNPQGMVFYRSNMEFIPITNFFNNPKLMKLLADFLSTRLKNKKNIKLNIFIILLKALKFSFVLKISTIVFYLITKRLFPNLTLKNPLLFVNSHTMCGYLTYDEQIAKDCQCGMIIKRGKDIFDTTVPGFVFNKY